MRGKRRLPIRSGFLNSILGGGREREKREKKIVSENEFDPRNFFFMKQRVNEREIKERDPNESEW